MKKMTIASAIAVALMGGTAYAGECTMERDLPAMPDPSAATVEDRTEAIKEIKAYQAELTVYRDCLNARMRNDELPDEERQAALGAYNVTVDRETEMVDGWVAFNAAYQEINS